MVESKTVRGRSVSVFGFCVDKTADPGVVWNKLVYKSVLLDRNRLVVSGYTLIFWVREEKKQPMNRCLAIFEKADRTEMYFQCLYLR
jgi:hypothetical protein